MIGNIQPTKVFIAIHGKWKVKRQEDKHRFQIKQAAFLRFKTNGLNFKTLDAQTRSKTTSTTIHFHNETTRSFLQKVEMTQACT
jgi:hypothetical protein